MPTAVVAYTPFAADGTLRPALHATAGSGARCETGSFVVAAGDAYRCFVGLATHDPCYLDRLASVEGRSVVVCVRDPWSRRVLRLSVQGAPDGADRAGPEALPWALRMASGRRCVVVTGASPVVRGRRLNYRCRGGRYLFGRPDRRAAVWTIRQARTPGGAGMRRVAIRTAFR